MRSCIFLGRVHLLQYSRIHAAHSITDEFVPTLIPAWRYTVYSILRVYSILVRNFIQGNKSSGLQASPYQGITIGSANQHHAVGSRK